MSLILFIIAVLCVVYYVVLALYIGFASMTALIWLILGGLSGIFSVVWKTLKNKGVLSAAPLWLKVGAITTAVVGLFLFLFVESFVVRGMYEKPEEDADYLVVLGAKVQGDRVSRSLKYRLDTAIQYAMEHPDVTIIVSGGQGKDEEMTEAQAMYEYLVSAGISPYRIIREGWSKSTKENLMFSMAYMDEGDRVVIVTNGFHAFRALEMAKKLGLVKASVLPAPSDGCLLPHSLLREFFAVIKAKWLGNI